jgi:hypothetical protein
MADNGRAAELLEIHKICSEELRHTATIIWQFAISIVTLQGGAVALSAKPEFQTALGKSILAVGLFLAICFSVMLVRQATERRGFRDRSLAVEDELRKTYPDFFVKIDSPFRRFTSIRLAQLLLIESVIGFVFFLWSFGILAGLIALLVVAALLYYISKQPSP